jgi:Winged helix DNA-binding domain
MYNLRLSGPPLASPAEAVRWLVAVQSQDYGPAKWSLGERTRGAGDADVDRAYADGLILRTHVLRPTWHFVHPDDIRWLLALTAPRVHAQNGDYYRQTGVDEAALAKCNRLLSDVLRGGNHLTRKELEPVLAGAGIAAKGLAMVYALMRAELDGLVCSGAPKGKQHTYALLDERAPDARTLPRDEALVELVARYFASHGPATEKDLRWWSSLTLAEIRQGIEAAGARLEREEHDGVAYWSAGRAAVPAPASPKVHLLQGYDEYFVGYSESRGLCDRARMRPDPTERMAYIGAVILDSQLAGHWKRTVTKRAVAFEVALHAPLEGARAEALRAAADAHGAFLGLPATVRATLL